MSEIDASDLRRIDNLLRSFDHLLWRCNRGPDDLERAEIVRILKVLKKAMQDG